MRPATKLEDHAFAAALGRDEALPAEQFELPRLQAEVGEESGRHEGTRGAGAMFESYREGAVAL
ncbi:MAG: hypothetical protein WD069_10000 [Planctomycetales bacterium]